MVKTVWKYPLKHSDWQAIEMPSGAQILDVQIQNDAMTLWAIVSPTAPTMRRNIYIVGTGRPLPDTLVTTYIATCQFLDGKLVYHVFDGGEEPVTG